MEYNTTRNHLGMKEYGRHIQKMVDHLLTIEDRQKRQQQAEVVIEIMATLNPQLKTIEDYKHKLWDHLFVVSDFKLEVDSPYPILERETYIAKPEPLKYPRRYPKYHHLGKNLENIIDKAMKEENPEKKHGFANAIAYYMKLSYSNWHNELIHDDAIRSELNNITGGELEFTNTPYIKHRTVIEQDFPTRGRGRQNFGGRNNNNRGGQQSQGGNNSRGGNNNNRNKQGGGGGNRNNNNNNRNFKKRF